MAAIGSRRMREQMLRAGLLAALTLAGLALAAPREAEAHSQRAPWCANMGDGLTDCSYFTWEQCRATVSGLPGYCSRNLRADAYAEAPPRKRRYRHRRYD